MQRRSTCRTWRNGNPAIREQPMCAKKPRMWPKTERSYVRCSCQSTRVWQRNRTTHEQWRLLWWGDGDAKNKSPLHNVGVSASSDVARGVYVGALRRGLLSAGSFRYPVGAIATCKLSNEAKANRRHWKGRFSDVNCQSKLASSQ